MVASEPTSRGRAARNNHSGVRLDGWGSQPIAVTG